MRVDLGGGWTLLVQLTVELKTWGLECPRWFIGVLVGFTCMIATAIQTTRYPNPMVDQSPSPQNEIWSKLLVLP